MHLWFKRRALAGVSTAISTIITSKGAGIKGGISSLRRHRENVLVVHHEACCSVTAEMNLKEEESSVPLSQAKRKKSNHH